jgi:hypothetical protein
VKCGEAHLKHVQLQQVFLQTVTNLKTRHHNIKSAAQVLHSADISFVQDPSCTRYYAVFPGKLDPENEGITILLNVGNRLPSTRLNIS